MAKERCAENIIQAFEYAKKKKFTRKPFIVGKQTVTYGQVIRESGKIFALLSEFHIQPGDRVFISTENEIKLAILFISLLRAGVVPLIIDPETKDFRFQHLLALADPQLIIADKGNLEYWQLPKKVSCLSIKKDGGLLQRLFAGRDIDDHGNPDYQNRIDRLEPGEAPSSIDQATDSYVLFTSGTTQSPKGVRITHENLAAHLKTLSTRFGYTEDSKILNLLKLYHADGIIQGPVITFFNRATLFRPFDFQIPRLHELADSLYRDRITHWVAVPTMLAMILKFCSDQIDAFKTEDFRFIISTGAYLNESLWREFEDHFKVRIVNIYGLTETVIAGLFCGPDENSRKIGTVGKPFDCEIKIVDDNEINVRSGDIGELRLRGKNVMAGYLNNPNASAEVLNDGWLCTGDLASVDAEGFVTIHGRKKEIIISGGINISPFEISEILLLHPSVEAAITVGIPDPEWGEIVASAVTVNNGLDEEALFQHCRDYLEESKVPKRIEIVDELPMGPTGKIKQNETKQWIIAQKENRASIQLENLESNILRIAAACFNQSIDHLSLSNRLENTPGWDSLSHLDFITRLEDAYQIQFTPGEMLKIEGLNDAHKLVREKTNA